MKRAGFRFKFVRTLFLHQDDVLAADQVKAWRSDPKNKSSAKGDDREPPWTWKTYLYHDGKHIGIPGPNIMSALKKAGTEFKLGSSRKSLKAASQSLIRIDQEHLDLVLHTGELVQVKKIEKIKDNWDFQKHADAAHDLGFLLDVRRVPVGTSKHIRVRPKFVPGCLVEGTAVLVDETKINVDTFRGLCEYAGEFVGLGDWRPGAPKSPGPHGMFTAEVWEMK